MEGVERGVLRWDFRPLRIEGADYLGFMGIRPEFLYVKSMSLSLEVRYWVQEKW
jgi:hypothetical protein